jgi:sugar phosphate isomerase/epimerase
MPCKLAVHAAALDSDVRQAAQSAGALGAAGIQVPRSSPSLHLPDLSASGRRELLSVLRTSHLEIAGLKFDLDKTGFGPTSDIDAALERCEQMLEIAAGLNCRLVCVDIGPLPEPATVIEPKPAISAEKFGAIFIPESSETKGDTTLYIKGRVPFSSKPFDSVFAASVDGALSELGNRANRYGVTIAFGNELASFAALGRALQSASCPWFGIDLNPVAILRDEWPQPEIFSRLGQSIRHVRARDAVLGADRRTRPAVVGMGSVLWEKLLANLDDAGYSRWITVDSLDLADQHGSAIAGMRHLKALLNA